MRDQNIQKFTKTFEKYSDSIFRHLYFRLSDRDSAKEITQDTFLRFWKILESGEEVLNEKAYLYRIAHNLYVNELRDRKPHLSLDHLSETQDFDPGDGGESEENLLDKMDAKKVVDLFDEMDEFDKAVLAMRFVNDLSIQEISEYLEKNENLVSVRLHRAIKKIRKIIEDRYE